MRLAATSERTVTVAADFATRTPVPVLASVGARERSTGAELLVAVPTDSRLAAWVVRAGAGAD